MVHGSVQLHERSQIRHASDTFNKPNIVLIFLWQLLPTFRSARLPGPFPSLGGSLRLTLGSRRVEQLARDHYDANAGECRDEEHDHEQGLSWLIIR